MIKTKKRNYSPKHNGRDSSIVPRYHYQGNQVNQQRNQGCGAKRVVGETEIPHRPASEVHGQGHRSTTEDDGGDPGKRRRSDDPCSSVMAVKPPHHQGEGAKRRNSSIICGLHGEGEEGSPESSE